MGWLTLHRATGLSNKEFFQAQLGEKLTILRCATINNKEFYAAVQADDGVFAYVALIDWSPNSHYNFGYKDMTESCGPSARRCPEVILRLLSPLDELGFGPSGTEWARSWRNDCWAYNLRCAAARRVKPGMAIRFNEPIAFSDGASTDTFEFVKRSSFRRHPDQVYCSIRNWRERPFSFVDEVQS